VGTPYIGEIRMFAGNFPPQGWMFCEGQVLPISNYQPLFTLIGTMYGGDGATTFNLPDLRGRIPVHQGTGPGGTPYSVGQQGGVEQVALTLAQMPAHTHAAQAQSGNGTQAGPGNGAWAREQDPNLKPFSTAQNPSGTMNAASLTATGGNQPHENRMPFLAVSFIMALEGVYPSQG